MARTSQLTGPLYSWPSAHQHSGFALPCLSSAVQRLVIAIVSTLRKHCLFLLLLASCKSSPPQQEPWRATMEPVENNKKLIEKSTFPAVEKIITPSKPTTKGSPTVQFEPVHIKESVPSEEHVELKKTKQISKYVIPAREERLKAKLWNYLNNHTYGKELWQEAFYYIDELESAHIPPEDKLTESLMSEVRALQKKHN